MFGYKQFAHRTLEDCGYLNKKIDEREKTIDTDSLSGYIDRYLTVKKCVEQENFQSNHHFTSTSLFY
jgi:hypothetical protein